MRSNNRENIEKLLSLFMEGMTTVEEEAQLADYFRSEKRHPKGMERLPNDVRLLRQRYARSAHR